MQNINIQNSCGKFNFIVNFVFFMLVFALSISLLVNSIPQKVFYLASYLCIFILIFKAKELLRGKLFQKNFVLLISSFFIFGLVRIFWAEFISIKYEFLSDVALSILNDYALSGKRFILGVFIITVMACYSNEISERCIKLSKIVLFFGAVTTLFFGIKEYELTHTRIFLTANAPSSTAYMVIFMYCSYLWLPIKKANKKWLLVDMLLMISIFCLVILSGTRIAFLAYFFITLYQINRHYGLMNILKPMRNRLIALVVISVIAFLSGNRWVEAFNNIKEYDKNSSTSVGARVAIWDSGLHFFPEHLGFTSPDVRTKSAREYIALYHTGNAEAYKNVQSNMHNEFLDVSTLQGIAGLASLLFIYYSVLMIWISRNVLMGIAMPATALFIMGMTDTVLFFPATAMLFIISTALCVVRSKSDVSLP
ncbi:O-antigen ligase family protein [Pantoea stewartii]|uniref:O-antigen ligase family protein n=1 Tax=Pantoea stewartii TaxID=66269 RepID=UPI0033665902